MLTVKEIQNAKPGEKTRKLSDAHGLYLAITPNGARSWRYDYRIAGRRKTLAIGLFPTVPLSEARERHAEARRLVERGICPAQAKQKARKLAAHAATNTLQAIAESWYSGLAPHRSDSWKDNRRRWLDDRIFPKFGNQVADSIEPADVLELLQGIANEGHANTAEGVRQLLSRVFMHGVRTMRCKTDPAHACRGAIVVPPTVHCRPLSAKELPGFLAAIEGYSGQHPTIIASKLLLLTLSRKNELTGVRWSELELDVDEPTWRIPLKRMKGRLEHAVPLSRQASELFLQAKALAHGSEFVFPSLGRLDEHMSNTTLNRMFERLGVDVTPHGIRATASTLLNESGLFRSDVIERALAHVEQNRTRASYNAAEYLSERRVMLQWWADYLDGVRTGNKVIPFKRSA
jgi:integrase